VHSGPSNLGLKEKKKRLFLGILLFTAGAALSIYLSFQEVLPVFRLICFPLFFFGILGFLQAKQRTCVFLAGRKLQNLDAGQEPVPDPSVAEKLKIRAQSIVLKALFLAGILTLIAIFV
jgi:hypothetical protein